MAGIGDYLKNYFFNTNQGYDNLQTTFNQANNPTTIKFKGQSYPYNRYKTMGNIAGAQAGQSMSGSGFDNLLKMLAAYYLTQSRENKEDQRAAENRAMWEKFFGNKNQQTTQPVASQTIQTPEPTVMPPNYSGTEAYPETSGGLDWQSLLANLSNVDTGSTGTDVADMAAALDWDKAFGGY